jgi:uncharacterized protein
LAALDVFLSQPSNPEGTLSLGETRGFLLTVASAPELIQPSEWIPFIFGGEEPEFDDMEQVQQSMGTLMSLYNEANDVVRAEGQRLPDGCEFYDDLLANLEPGAPISQWCRGFAAGSLWLEESWEPYMIEEMSEDMGACLTTLSFFASRSMAESIVSESENPETTLEGAAAMFRDLFPEAIAAYAQIGMAIRKVVQETESAGLEAEGSAAPVGRNAPCPCGSGKKYKRCCLPH